MVGIPTLVVADHYWIAIDLGRKTATMRLGSRVGPMYPALGPAQLQHPDGTMKPITIVKIVLKRFRDTDINDAMRCGMFGVIGQREAMKRHYPQIHDDSVVTIFHWKDR